MSNAVTSPMNASSIIGIPQRIMEIHAMSNGKGEMPAILKSSAAPEMIRKMISRFVSPNSSSFFNFCK